MYTRYGKMQTKDYIFSWIIMVLMFLMGVGSFFVEVDIWYPMLLIVIPIFWFVGVRRAYQEKFTLEEDRILIQYGNREKEVPLPKDLVIVLSELDLHERMGSYSFGGECQYFATIAKEVTGGEVWQTLHAKKIKKKYTASYVDSKLAYDYVYSFVCDKALLRQLLKDRNCYVILPASLKPIFYEMLSTRNNVEVRVDPYF